MKHLLITLFISVCFAACEKAELTPSGNTSEKKETEKLANNKTKYKCLVKGQGGTTLGTGWTCSGQGTECGRPNDCKLFPTWGDDVIIFEDMNEKEFIDMWNDEKGRELLRSKGVYDEIAE